MTGNIRRFVELEGPRLGSAVADPFRHQCSGANVGAVLFTKGGDILFPIEVDDPVGEDPQRLVDDHRVAGGRGPLNRKVLFRIAVTGRRVVDGGQQEAVGVTDLLHWLHDAEANDAIDGFQFFRSDPYHFRRFGRCKLTGADPEAETASTHEVCDKVPAPIRKGEEDGAGRSLPLNLLDFLALIDSHAQLGLKNPVWPIEGDTVDGGSFSDGDDQRLEAAGVLPMTPFLITDRCQISTAKFYTGTKTQQVGAAVIAISAAAQMGSEGVVTGIILGELISLKSKPELMGLAAIESAIGTNASLLRQSDQIDVAISIDIPADQNRSGDF